MGRVMEAADAMRAVFELARARRWLLRADPVTIASLATNGTAAFPAQDDSHRIGRVRAAILRAHHRVPWRADCLVQALAAQRWLGAMGVPSRLHMGVRSAGEADPAGPTALASMADGGRFMAHAWLEAGGEIVTGGEIAGYARFGASPAKIHAVVNKEEPGQTLV